MRLFFLFVLLVVEMAVFSKVQSLPRAPKLVVMVVIDELSDEQLYKWQHRFEKEGVLRLLNQGTFVPRVAVNSQSLYNGASMATLYSGTTPAIHGIVSDFWFDRISQVEVSALLGPVNARVADSLIVPSCATMLSSSIADELRMFYPKHSKIASVGLSPRDLCFAAGHQTSDIYWFNANTGSFELEGSKDSSPQWLKDYNGKRLADLYKKREWGPLYDLNSYYEYKFRPSATARQFLYRFDNDRGYEKMSASPYGNVMVRDIAASLILNESFGKDEYPDLLTVSFTLKPFLKNSVGLVDAEVEDMFLRLDQELTGFIRLLSEQVGFENVLMVVAGGQNPGVMPQTLVSAKTPSGVFGGRKALSLLNLYFMAQHGQGKWVQMYHDGAIYLNRQLIEDKKLSMEEMRKKAADFLMQMSGVARVYTYDQLSSVDSGQSVGVIAQSFHPKRSGDVIIELEPGWAEELPDGTVRVRPVQSRYVPVVFFGGMVPGKVINRSIQLVDIAPTICTFLQIPFPNGCVGQPVYELFK